MNNLYNYLTPNFKYTYNSALHKTGMKQAPLRRLENGQ